MSTYNRKKLTHTRKVISSLGSSVPRHSSETALESTAKQTRRLFENVSIRHMSSILTIREEHSSYPNIHQIETDHSENWDDVKQTPTDFVSISKPSVTIDRLLRKRKIAHEEAVKNMKNELRASHTACQQEFRNRSVAVKIQINGLRKQIEDVQDKLRKTELLESGTRSYVMEWKKANDLIDYEKHLVDRFYNYLLQIEKKRLEYVKPILQKYYKIFHKISHLLPYDIQVYLENEIMTYNQIILENYRTYADLRLHMFLHADTAKIELKYWMEESEMHDREKFVMNTKFPGSNPH